MIPSKFNIVIPNVNGSDCIVYNTFSDSEAQINSKIRSLLESGNHLKQEERKKILAQYGRELSELGFLVESRESEDAQIRDWFARKRTNQDELRITVLPTYNCNLRCIYCFQSGINHKYTISHQTIIKLAEWAGKRMDAIRPERLSLLFYGGEPLTCRQEVIAISALLTDEARKRAVDTSIQIITNGTLMDPDFVNAMVPMGLKGAKVTIDGMPEFHDRLRPGPNNKATFEIILDNLLKSKDKIKYSIGSNFNAENAESLPRLYDYLLDLGLRESIAQVNFRPIFKGGSSSFCETCAFAETEPSELLGLIEQAEKRGLKTIDWADLGPCGFHKRDAYTVDPQGKIFKCEGLVEISQAVIGDLSTENIEEKSEEFINRFDLFGECGDCSYLPVCGGGCRYWGYEKTGSLSGVSCEKQFFDTVAREVIRRRTV